MADKITPAQKRKIFATARELGLDNDLLHAVVVNRTGKKHISDLNKHQAIMIIDELEHRAGRSTRCVVLPDNRQVVLATKEQLWKMRQLEKQLGWDANPKRLRGFCRKYAGKVENIEWLTKAQAWRVIEGLKALLAREQEKAGGSETKGVVMP